ncbi:TPA: IS3 family transposase, partial [Streptococcus suis]
LYLCCFEYINRYNSKRPHNSLGGYTPNEIEDIYINIQE